MTRSAEESPVRLGAYRLESVLGRGGMGEVFLAWDERLERHVAIKRVLSASADGKARARFRREARAAARLSHPAIVQVFDLLEDEGEDHLVMEYVEGRGLVEWIRSGELELEHSLALTSEIAEGLAEAHGKGLVHRDLKPENIRVTRSGHAKILDFGLARLLWREDSQAESVEASLTQSGALVGTLHAMSPEQASGRPIDHRSDLFALGSLLYEMLTGQAPFRGDNVLDTLRRVTSEEPAPLAQQRPSLPSELVDLVSDLLAKDPDHRPQNAHLVRTRLERLRGLPTSADPVQTPSPTAKSGTASSKQVPADLPTGEWATPEDTAPSESIERAVRTLWLTGLDDSTHVLRALGEEQAAGLFARLDREQRDLLERFDGRQVERGLGLFERAFDAVVCALAYHQRLIEVGHELDVDLRARSAIHLGEWRLRHQPESEIARGARPLEVEGEERALLEQLAQLARARQTLLSRTAFDLARRADEAAAADEGLRWLAHGTYLLDRVDEPVEVFEVGVEGFAPLIEPSDAPGARRAVSFSDELVLGWRPARGQNIPRRSNWTLERRLGEGGFGEVWLASHPSGERRVFKFCFEASRLRALKREVTLFRLLRDALGHRDDIARLLDWNFEAAPYFLEAEHTPGGDLVTWSYERGGLETVPLRQRLEWVAQIAEALAAAHSVGVLHKDVKPENILIAGDNEKPRARLTDFGVGSLVDRASLSGQGLPIEGFTATLTEEASTAGSRRYLAPELLEGKAATVQADLYSLGVWLYQMVVGDLSRALATGWRREVEDPLLAEDIALLVDGKPECRPASAGIIAERLRNLDARRSELREVARTVRRWQRLRLAAGVGAALLVITALFAFQAERARREAEELQSKAEVARDQAEDLIGFMLGDLQQELQAIGRLDALDGAGEKALEYFAALAPEDLSSETLARHAQALNQMGDVRMAQGDLDAALEMFEQALSKTEALVEADREDPEALFELGQSYFWVGNTHLRRGELEAVQEPFERYLDISEELLRREPEKSDWWLEVSYAHNNLGELLLRRQNPALALEHFRALLDCGERLVEMEPQNPQWRFRLATAHLRLAQVDLRQGLLREGHAASQRAVEILAELAETDPDQAPWLRRLAVAREWATNLHMLLGDLDAADVESRQSLDLLQRLQGLDPNHREWQGLLATAHQQRGSVLSYQGRYPEAFEHLHEAVAQADLALQDHRDQEALDHQITSHTFLAQHLLRAGDVEPALNHAQTAVRLAKPDTAGVDRPKASDLLAHALLVLGQVHSARLESAQAEAAWQRSQELLASLSERQPRHPIFLFFKAQTHIYLEESEQARPLVYTLLGMGFDHPQLASCCSEVLDL